MKSITAETYAIHFNEFGYQQLTDFIHENSYSSVFLLVDENTNTHCAPLFLSKLATTLPIEIIEIEAGETHKNMDTCLGVWHALTELQADRSSLLLNLGGGVLTDLGGFTASCFKRGIDFINIPTSLLGMVDAAIGGKTGIDLGVLKNQIGLFSEPKMVLIDADFLHTLPTRELKSGTAEILKYGLTSDATMYHQLRDGKKALFTDFIHRSIAIKNNIVLSDPTEKNTRKTLNFGHTLGHAIESYFLASDRANLAHGEAIAIGMVCECYLSNQLQNFSLERLQDIKNTVLKIYPKVAIKEMEFEAIFMFLKHDKKNTGGHVHFVLLSALEKPHLDCVVPKELLSKSLQFYLA